MYVHFFLFYKVFENCTCIAESFVSTNSSVLEAQNDKADDGLCSTDCDKLIPFIVVMFVLVLLFLLIEIPYYHYTLR